ncbi:MAG: CcdB family protein [Hyphomicrobiaceae bacterium]
MARFDGHRVTGLASPVVDIQADVLRDLRTRIVIPLARADEQAREAANRLRPKLMVAGTAYILNTPEMAAIACSTLEEPIASLQDQHHAIVDAVDFLMQGF